MKKLLLISFLAMIAFTSQAQNIKIRGGSYDRHIIIDDFKKDTYKRVRYRHKRHNNVQVCVLPDIMGSGYYQGGLGLFEFGFNGLTTPDYSNYSAEEKGFLDLKNGKSIYAALNLARIAVPLNLSQTVGVSSGLGIAWHDYTFSNDITLIRENGMVTPTLISSDYKKTKLNTFSLNVPLMLKFGRDREFFAFGVYGNFIVKSHTKIKFPKHKYRKDLYINPFQYGLTCRMGYKDMYIFGNYALSKLFKDDKGPETQTFTIGIGLGI